MLTKIRTATLNGVDGYPVTVETDLHDGTPGFNVVGLADATIREAAQRIKPAIMNCGYTFPRERVTVNLAPAGRPKEGSHFDLPIALGIMMLGEPGISDPAVLEDALKTEKSPVAVLRDTAFIGELSLDGSLNKIRGALPLAIALRNQGIRNLVLPEANAQEASILEDINILPVSHLRQAADYILNRTGIIDEEFDYEDGDVGGGPDRIGGLCVYKRREITDDSPGPVPDFEQVIGQESLKRAIVIGTGGGHGMLMMGSPGCGKTMMAKRIPTILPELTYEEKLELTGIYSVAGRLSEDHPIIENRPFRSPHHTITMTGLLGGGARPRPGELSLAHRGVLFLDELGEFDSRVIDAMRQPVEDGFVKINRNLEEVIFPSSVMIVIAANPCKCGNLWDDRKVCTCSRQQLESHRRKLMGPFTDRVDMHIKVSPVSREGLEQMKDAPRESSAQMAEKVRRIREVQNLRYAGTPYRCNGQLDEKGIKKYCTPDEAGRKLLISAYERLGLSMRAYNKMLKVARTIADLEGSEDIKMEHVAEALTYRTVSYDDM